MSDPETPKAPVEPTPKHTPTPRQLALARNLMEYWKTHPEAHWIFLEAISLGDPKMSAYVKREHEKWRWDQQTIQIEAELEAERQARAENDPTT